MLKIGHVYTVVQPLSLMTYHHGMPIAKMEPGDTFFVTDIKTDGSVISNSIKPVGTANPWPHDYYTIKTIEITENVERCVELNLEHEFSDEFMEVMT